MKQFCHKLLNCLTKCQIVQRTQNLCVLFVQTTTCISRVLSQLCILLYSSDVDITRIGTSKRCFCRTARFGATVCKTVLPMLSGCCLSCPILSVCLFCLSVTLVYCVQTALWNKLPLGMEIDLGAGHIVLDGHPAFPLKRGTAPTFCPMSILVKRLDGSKCHLVRW